MSTEIDTFDPNEPIEVETVDTVSIRDLKSPQSAGRLYSSFDRETKAGRIRTLAVMQAPAERLDAMVGKSIHINDVIANVQTIKGDQAIRLWLVDDKAGKVYQTTSKGVYQALSLVYQMLGQPSDWDEAYEFRVSKVQAAQGPMLNLEIVLPKDVK